MENARNYALKTLMNVVNNESFIKESFPKDITFNNYKDFGMARDIVYGTTRNLYYIDYIFSKLSNRPLEKIDPIVLNISRIAIYELCFRKQSADYAVINEAVELTKKYSNIGSSKFVNAILRQLLRKKDFYLKIETNERLEYLSLKYSYPKFLLNLWNKEFGDSLEDLLKAFDNEAETSFRVNTLKINRENLIENLISEGYNAIESKISNDGIIITNPSGVFESKAFKSGFIYAQGESSMALADNLLYKSDMKILDLCSAPGGKAGHIAQKLSNKGQIDCFDINDEKLDLIIENTKRLGIKNINTKVSNAMKFDKQLENKYDIVLCDVPCSGFGLIRKKPEIKIFTNEGKIKSLVAMQKRILKNAKNYVKRDGILVYSTCTINYLENEEVINLFLENNNEFEMVENFIKFDPLKHNTDGFFIAKMRRKDG
ncbi:MAG: 16S rRNA (cytosine(967)-C(5))-methyltransferase RsmB [Tissierellia bacterium]|nr:16S rRNA (cytosine(967)-C(5))-methyltransferase RsmB [Tissierellia bacterium]